ncbi:efflux RND transporter permease subunit [Algiphilus sp.]|uniref:efflux RND transporter permease subunit n=1 Tax=Algiphilus sp. TaxID=1872431 RepID=UPI0025BE68C0|nr:efflux RND transporter permease subunit [Algiphilus sp.]MCK5769934.1 efflux RND transporter permease subunit [Algiphilus sp.]
MLHALIAGSARRPIAVTQVFIGLVLFGLVAAGRLPVTLLPDLSYPTVTVQAELPGAAPEEVETLLARPLEETLGAVRGLRRIESRSQIGRADVTLRYHWGTDMAEAVLDVRERLDALTLPRDAGRPVVLRFDPGGDPIVRYALVRADGAEHPEALKRLRRLAEDAVARPLESVAGIAAVEIAGGLEEEIAVVADVERLARFGIGLQRIGDRLAAENANISGGQVEQGTNSYLVRTLNPFASIGEIGDTIIERRGGRDLRVRDVAEVREGFAERDTVFRVGGVEAVEIAIYKEGDANTVAVADAARGALDALAGELPAGFALEPLFDQSRFIRAAIDEVRTAAVLGGLLAVAVLWLFLGRGWITAVIALTIPVAVITTFSIMGAAGIGLNVMSLGGFALAIGMLVDDAVVVLEAIARRRDAGASTLDAAIDGTREVAGPVIASTATTVAVFLPLVFVEGVAGQLFADQAVVISGALIVSMMVALTLIPALAARGGGASADASAPAGARRVGRLMRPLHRGAALAVRPVLRVLTAASAGFRRGHGRVAAGYDRVLRVSLAHRATVVAGALLLGLLALALLPRIGVSLIPPFAQHEFRVDLTLPPGTPLARTDEVAARAARAAESVAGVAGVYGSAGVGTRLNLSAETGADFEAELSVRLDRDAGVPETVVRAAVARALDGFGQLDYRFTEPTLFNFDAPLAVELAGYDLDTLIAAAARVEAMLHARGYGEVENDARRGQPELRVDFDTQRASALGLESAGIADTVANAVDGLVATHYRLPDREIAIRVRGGDALRSDIAALRALPVNPAAGGAALPLSAVADVTRERGPAEIRRADGSRVAVVSARPADDSLGAAASALAADIAAMDLPAEVDARVTGQSDELDASLSSGLLALTLAVFVVYLIMAAQFESLSQPLVILLTVPLAGIGAVLTLWATASTLNVVALIGFIVLAGIVVKNGIVMIDLAGRLRADGLAPDAAIAEAARVRLRAILITTLTTVLGLAPLLFGGDEGAELRRPLALTLIGGISVSTLLTLVVLPAVYSLVERGARPG